MWSLLWVVLLLWTTKLLAESVPVGYVKTVKGQVTLTRMNKSIPIHSGTLLETKDRLDTHHEGMVALVFIDDARFVLGPNSQLVIQTFIFDPKTRTGIHQSQGDGNIVVESGDNAVSVQTSRAIVQVHKARVGINTTGGKTP